ncbi:serine hydrolase domain-containing protein [Agromyces larvae]|uniref:Beta-lactamase family protein n=1 Tax=Agromyces larvae TaxID=2929802 RepID=A0ABY4C5E6_9MICO|nr:serine hydrolase [Agromyces larvae]UOE45391.1 beta-lactamase family protein [Agromyces larvae]
MTQLFPRVTPAEAGLDPAALDRLFRSLDGIRDVHSAMVLRDGAVVAEGWWHPYAADEPHLLFSVSKSFTSAAVGLAIDEGLLSLDDRVVDLLPDDAPADPDEHLAELRVGHLLTMTSGHDGDAMRAVDEQPAGPGAGWARQMLALPVVHEPGSRFEYNTGATYLLAAILHRVTGEHLVDYLMPRLFEPLGIDRPTWEEDPDGIVVGGFGLSLTTEQLAAFGQLLLQRGRWGDRQLLPPEWVVAATAAEVPNAPSANPDWEQGYGFQFWRCRFGAYRADGAFGQFAIVWPEPRLVFAITGGLGDMQPVLDAIWAAFPEFAGGEVAASGAIGTDASEHAVPQDLAPLDLATLAVPTVAGSPSSPIEPRIDGRPYAVDANPLGLSSFTVSRDAVGRLVWGLGRDGGPVHVTTGFGAWHPGELPLGEGSALVATSAAWVDETTLAVRIVSVSTPFSWTHTIAFDPDGARAAVTVDQNVAFGPTRLVDAVGRAVPDAA